MKIYVFFCLLLVGVLGAESKKLSLSLEDFNKRVEQNSIELLKSSIAKESLKYEGRAAKSLNTIYIDSNMQNVRSPSGGKEIESEMFLMFSPRLPWVSSALRKMYNARMQTEERRYELTRQLALISAKRLYLDYLAQKEQLNAYKELLENANNQLDIARSRYNSGVISQSQFLFFQSDALNVQMRYAEINRTLVNLLYMLQIVLGITDEIDELEVAGLGLDSLLQNQNIQNLVDKSLHLQVIDMMIKDYEFGAKLASRSRFEMLEIGVGGTFAESSNNLGIQFKLPIPLTRKYDAQKHVFLSKQSGALSERELMRKKMKNEASSYMKQLGIKAQTIHMAEENEKYNADLANITKEGYEAGKISAFEYLSVKNTYANAIISTIQAKRDYMNTLSTLEEILGTTLK